jgi:anti-sigma factor RsiW
MSARGFSPSISITKRSAGYIDGLADLEEREIAEQHLSICAECREEVTAFLEDRRENDSMLSIRHLPPDAVAPATKASVWRIGGLWSPARAAALIVLALGVGVVFVEPTRGSGRSSS